LEVARQRLGCIVQLAPGDTDHAPALGLQAPIPIPIGLKRRASFMSRPAVQLHHQPRLAPETVHLDPPSPHLEPGIEMRPGKSKPINERQEEVLEVASREANRPAQSLEAQPQVCVAAMARMPGKQNR
jgi:hypothetical protein